MSERYICLMPLVLAYCCSDESMTSVEIDDEEGGYQMGSYILAQGYRKLGVISGRADNIHAKRRLLGCQRALFEAGILDTLTPGTFRIIRHGFLMQIGSLKRHIR